MTSYVASLDELVRDYLGMPHNGTTMKLYRNLGDGSFRDVSAEAGLNKALMPMGANFGDIDNDGFLDMYLGTGNPSYGALAGSALLRNKDGRAFVNVTASSGTGELHRGHGVAFADLDNDGDEDIVFEVGGMTPGDRHAIRLFENPGHGNDWIALKLVGVKSNRTAVGARIKVTVEDEKGQRRAIHRTVGPGGSFGASPLLQHIGLGQIREDRRSGGLVAHDRHAAAILERRPEPVAADRRVRRSLHAAETGTGPPGWQEGSVMRRTRRGLALLAPAWRSRSPPGPPSATP